MGINTYKWRPSLCSYRYSTIYDIPQEDKPQPKEEPPKAILVNACTGKRGRSLWCCGCMRHLVDPFCFGCGHRFCKCCIASLRSDLVKDFGCVVSDVRATIKCPVANCSATMDTLPLINGDFRFRERRVEKNESNIVKKNPHQETTTVPPRHQKSPKEYELSPENPKWEPRIGDLFEGLDDVEDGVYYPRKCASSLSTIHE